MLIQPAENINVKLNLDGTRRMINHDPWVRRQSLTRFKMPPPPGTRVRFQDVSGNFLGHGFSDAGEAPYRVLSRQRHPVFDAAWFELKVEEALGRRRELMNQRQQGAFRVLHGEADGLPGLAADIYGGWLVMDVLSAGASVAFLSEVEAALQEQLRPQGMLRRVRFEGGRRGKTAVGLERVQGGAPPQNLSFTEGLGRYGVDLLVGADLRHRDSIALAAGVAQNQRVLLSSLPESPRYAVACLKAGARLVTVASPDALMLKNCQMALAFNGLEQDKLEIIKADSFEISRRFAVKKMQVGLLVQGLLVQQKGRGGVFDAVHDTPSLAAAVVQRVEAGGNALFVAADCGFSRDGLAVAVAQGAVLAGAQTQLKNLGSVGADFPVLESFPLGLDFRLALVQVHLPGAVDLSRLRVRGAVVKKKKSKKSKNAGGKKTHHAGK